MFSEIGLGELDSNGEETGREDDAHNFECDTLANRAPGPRVEYTGYMRAHEHAERGAENDFINVELASRM